ncbi:MAG: signal recognition particle-docking protein FtsY [Nanoarchaeota archaeon]
MFDALRKKLGGWFGKKEEEKATLEKKPKEKKAKKEEKVKVSKKEIKAKVVKKEVKGKKKTKKEEFGVEEKLKEQSEAIEQEVPVKFEAGTQKYEPDLEKIQERLEEGEKEEIKDLEELKEEIKEEKEKGGFFSRLVKKITDSELKKEEFEEFFSEFEMILLENNVALVVVDKIKDKLSLDLVGKKFKKGEAEGKILESLKGSINEVLIEGEDLFEMINKKDGTFVILFFGINGSGKTTSIAKLAYLLKEREISCVLAAGDTFRAASIEQLETHANKIGVPIVKGDYGQDPASIAFEAKKYAEKHKIKVVLIDTAGRMYTKANLMREMEKIVKVANADLKVFVGESITGNDATEQAKTFNETAGIDGIILSKADVDEKAGTILSVSYVTGKPILFLGTGQEYKDLKEFKKKDVLKGLGLES